MVSRSLVALDFIKVAFVAFAATGCGSPPPPSPPSPAPAVAVASAAPGPVDSTPDSNDAAEPRESASPSEPPAPTAAPPAPPGVDTETWDLLAALCPVATLERPDGSIHPGCRAWPPWDQPETRPDGRAPRGTLDDRWRIVWDAADVDGTAFLPFVSRFPGSFTEPGRDQWVLYFEECRGVDGITITGCAAIVERRDGKWRVEDIQREAPFADCVVARRADGRDLLVCNSSTGAMYESVTTSVFFVDFTKPDGSRRIRIAELAHNGFDIPCMNVPASGASDQAYGSWTSGIVDLSVKKMVLKDIDRDGDADVTIEVERAYAPHTPAMMARVQQQCKTERFAPAEILLPKPTRFNLQFENDGQGLAPTSGTARGMAIWSKQHAPQPYAW